LYPFWQLHGKYSEKSTEILTPSKVFLQRSFYSRKKGGGKFPPMQTGVVLISGRKEVNTDFSKKKSLKTTKKGNL
jgi:hypothetical protein